MPRTDHRRRRLVLLASFVVLGTVAAACANGEHSVEGVSIPPPLSTTTTSTIPRTTTTTVAPTTTEPPPATLASTTTIVLPASGPPSSIDAEYVKGDTRRTSRIPCTLGPDVGQLVLGANCRHVIVDGMVREYVVYVPAGVKRETPAPLVVYLHGDNSDGDGDLTKSGWKRRADEDNVVVAFPTALQYDVIQPTPAAWQTAWNGYDLVDRISTSERAEGYRASAPLPADDVTFISTMVADIEYQWPIDTTRVFAAGSQTGADLVMRLALELPDQFAAVGMSAGGPGSPAHDLAVPTKSVPMMLIVGDQDGALVDTSLGTTTGGTIPLGVDAFVQSPVGAYLIPRLAAVTGTDPAAPGKDESKDPTHLTAFSLKGPGIGGGAGLVEIRIVQGLTNAYPTMANNAAKYIGTVELWKFFEQVAPGTP